VTYGHAWLIWRITSLVLAGIYCIAAVAGIIGIEETQDRIVWGIFLFGGAALIFLGQWLYGSRPVLSTTLVSIGTAAGAFALFWTLVVPLAAAVVIALGFALARRTSAPASR
jgi:hypothetical protein